MQNMPHATTYFAANALNDLYLPFKIAFKAILQVDVWDWSEKFQNTVYEICSKSL